MEKEEFAQKKMAGNIVETNCMVVTRTEKNARIFIER